MAASTAPMPPPTIAQTLQQSLRLPRLNVKPTIAIFLLLAVPLTIIFVISHFVLKPIAIDLALKLVNLSRVEPGSPEYYRLFGAIKKDLAVFFGDEGLFLLADTIVSLVAGLATIYTTHAAYTGEKISIKEVATRVAKGWKQPLITFLYIRVFSLGFVFLLGLLVELVLIVYKISSILVAIFVLLIVLCAVFSLYLAAVWALAIRVAAVEEGCYGLAAIGRAGLLIRGRKMQGLAIAFYFMLATAIILLAYTAITKGNPETSETVRLVLGCVVINLLCIIGFFQWIVFTVFYFGCKMNHGEEVNGRGFLGYSLVSSGAHIGADVP